MRGEIALEPRRRRRFDAASFLVLWTVLLVLIPASLVVSPLGAAGSPAALVGLLAGAWWLAASLGRTESRFSGRDPVGIAAAVFLVAILLSYLAATVRPIEKVELSAADRGLLIVLSWLGVLALTASGLSGRPALDRVLRALVVTTGLAAVLGVLQFLTHQAYVDRLQIPGLSWNSSLTSVYGRNGFARTAGTSTHPIEFGVLLTMVLPIALHLAFADDRSRLRRWWPVVAIAAAIPITLSRSTFLGLAVALAVLLPTWPKRRRRLAYVWVALGTLAVYSALPGLLGTMGRLFTNVSSDSSAQSRVNSLNIALHYWLQHPWTGRGFSTFLPAYRILDDQYLGLLVETGVVGVLALVSLLATAIVVATRTRRSSSDPVVRSMASALTATVAVAALACATFDAFGFPQVAAVLFLALGAIAALSRATAPSVAPPVDEETRMTAEPAEWTRSPV